MTGSGPRLLLLLVAGLPVAGLLPVQPAAAAGPEHPVATRDDTSAADLHPHTLQAWSAYEDRVDERYHAAQPAGGPFFALDAFGIAAWRAAAARDDVTTWRIGRARPGDGETPVKDGIIHHWAGAIVVPGMSVGQVLTRLSDLAGHEEDHYQDVVASRLLWKDGDRYRLFMTLRRSSLITVTYNTEHAVEYRRLGATRATARSASTRIAELADAGTPRERERPIGSDSGYLWRLNAYWRYEAVDGGVMIECESVSLSRAIPLLFRPLLNGMVERLARESLERTLTELRAALISAAPPARRER